MEIKGYTYGYLGKEGDYQTPLAIQSRQLLFETGVNWICLAFAADQKTFSSTEILYHTKNQPSDEDLLAVIKHAHDTHVKVCLKPMVNCQDYVWRAYINFPDEDMRGNDPYWTKWFASYQAYLCYYAELAESSGCEMLCIGCEMTGTERKERYWRDLITAIRSIYHGKITYNTNHGKENTIAWLDAIDYIGISGYYPVAKKGGASIKDMMAAWKKVATGLAKTAQNWNKPILFMEIGCRSALGCASMPWDFMHKEFPYSQEEQANFYESCLASLSDENWFAGMFWWDWSTKIYTTPEKAAADMGFNVHLKKAETVLKEWYEKL